MDNALVLRPNYAMSKRPQRETLVIRDARLIFRNFAGKAKQFNEEGDRNFSIELDEDLAKQMSDAGWNVKPLKKYDEDDPQMYHLPVTVRYDNYPPRVYMVTGDGERVPFRKALMTEDLVWMMDTLDLGLVHLTISASNWNMGGKTGKKAYLQSFFGHVVMDELEQEYADIEDMVQEDLERIRQETDANVVEGEAF